MKYSTMRTIGTSALLLAASLIVAVAASAATGSAHVRPDDRSGVRAVAVTNTSETFRPDDRAGLRGAGVVAIARVRPDDRAGPFGSPTAVASSVHYATQLGTDDGFDWRAAATGAGSVTGLILFLALAALILRRSHRRVSTSA
jgi:hypothetical protein